MSPTTFERLNMKCKFVTPFGSKATIEETQESLSCFESMHLSGSEWKFLATSDDHQKHAVWINSEQKSILEFSNGEVTVVKAPDELIFQFEASVHFNMAQAEVC